MIAGLAALEGLRHAEFLASEVVGVRVADDVLARLSRAEEGNDRLSRAADAAEEALAISTEIASWLRSRVQGLQITTVHGSAATAERLLERLAPILAR